LGQLIPEVLVSNGTGVTVGIGKVGEGCGSGLLMMIVG